jgi:hypothetical protein
MACPVRSQIQSRLSDIHGEKPSRFRILICPKSQQSPKCPCHKGVPKSCCHERAGSWRSGGISVPAADCPDPCYGMPKKRIKPHRSWPIASDYLILTIIYLCRVYKQAIRVTVVLQDTTEGWRSSSSLACRLNPDSKELLVTWQADNFTVGLGHDRKLPTYGTCQYLSSQQVVWIIKVAS